MELLNKKRIANNYPGALLLALNKAKTVSWRLGVAWTLVSEHGKVLVCNGDLFNQHSQSLINDLKTYQDAKLLYLSYCPNSTDLDSEELVETLRFSSLVELHIYGSESDAETVKLLGTQASIPTHRWANTNIQSAQTTGISWVRATRRPWIHVICSNSLGGGAYPLAMMSEELGVVPYVMLKGLESSLLYVQDDCSDNLNKLFNMADPHIFESSTTLLRSLGTLSASSVPVVTVVCNPGCLAKIINESMANEVSYFITLRSVESGSPALAPIVTFPENDQWVINSSEVRGDFMQVVLQKG